MSLSALKSELSEVREEKDERSKLQKLRLHLGRLLVSFISALHLETVDYNSNVIDQILIQFLKIVFLLAVAAMAAPAGQGEDVDPEDPEVQACATFAVESFNCFYHDPHVYQITEIKSVRRLNVGGGQYEIDLEVKKTQNLKENRSNPKPKDPTNREGPEVMQCYFSVLSSKWRNQRTLLRSSCH